MSIRHINYGLIHERIEVNAFRRHQHYALKCFRGLVVGVTNFHELVKKCKGLIPPNSVDECVVIDLGNHEAFGTNSNDYRHHNLILEVYGLASFQALPSVPTSLRHR